MKSRIALIAFAALLVVACGDDERGAGDGSQDSDAPKESSVFGGYLSAIDKAKAAGQAANDRQTRMEETLGYDPSTETHGTLGMTETNRAAGEKPAEADGMFGDMINSMNRAKGSRDMLNDRQRQIEALSGGGLQSTRKSDESAESPAMFEPPVAEANEDQTESSMFSGFDRAREIKDATNARHQELESMWGVPSQ